MRKEGVSTFRGNDLHSCHSSCLIKTRLLFGILFRHQRLTKSDLKPRKTARSFHEKQLEKIDAFSPTYPTSSFSTCLMRSRKQHLSRDAIPRVGRECIISTLLTAALRIARALARATGTRACERYTHVERGRWILVSQRRPMRDRGTARKGERKQGTKEDGDI